MTEQPKKLESASFAAANEIYRSISFQPSIQNQDETFGLTKDGRLVALGRIQRHGEELEIGGFWVEESLRGTGLARRMVVCVLDAIPKGQPAWCVAFTHLADFYRSFGMKDHPKDQAPAAIRDKLTYCSEEVERGTYQPVELLRYEA